MGLSFVFLWRLGWLCFLTMRSGESRKRNRKAAQGTVRHWSATGRHSYGSYAMDDWELDGKGKEKGKGSGSTGTGGFVEVLCCVIRVEFLSSVIEILLSQKKQHCYACWPGLEAIVNSR